MRCTRKILNNRDVDSHFKKNSSKDNIFALLEKKARMRSQGPETYIFCWAKSYFRY